MEIKTVLKKIEKEKKFRKELEDLINRYSIDTVIDASDYDIAEHLMVCLVKFGSEIYLKKRKKNENRV